MYCLPPGWEGLRSNRVWGSEYVRVRNNLTNMTDKYMSMDDGTAMYMFLSMKSVYEQQERVAIEISYIESMCRV